MLPPGTRIGPYEIAGSLGAGGMGEVYRARDARLGRDVAIKVLSAPFTSDADRLARFEREARMLASLNHPSIAAIYGLEHTSPGANQPVVPALVLELVEGETLADRIRRGPITTVAALNIARQIAEALDFAHERGIVHRDLKPANIKIAADDVVKVLDFGLAKALVSDLESASESGLSNSPTITLGGTRAGVILGTAAYMSPEQTRGKAVDERADIWAFGCVLYEMLTGSRTFKGESVSDTIVAILERDPDLSLLPESTPNGVRLLLRRCLQKDVKRRLRAIADARIEIDDAIAQPAVGGLATTAFEESRPRGLSWPALSMLGVGLTAAAGVGWLVGRQQVPIAAPAFDRVIRLVSTAAHEFGPVVSPDGKWVAYLSNARGPTDVWVKFIAGGNPVNLTATADLTVQSQDGIGGLAVSPDGSQIAFQAQARGQLSGGWVIQAPLGDAPRRLLPLGSSGMQWSPDGKRIAYVKTGGPLGDALMVADADGQNEVEIVKREGARHVHWVRWDSAGKFVYFNYGFANANGEPTEIFRVPASGGAVEPVVSTTRRAAFPFPSPDGRGLFYAANPDGADLSLWWKDFSSGRQHRITTGVGEYSAPSVSADGQRLVGTVFEVGQSLERIALTFDRPVKLEPLTDGVSRDLDPAWSPDGTRLVFSSSRAGTRTLWTTRHDLTQPAPLTSGAALDERPAFSPDGQHVAFVSDRGGRRGIWLVSSGGGAPRLIAAANVIDTISWSPDGRRIVFSTPVGDAPGLMTLDVTSGQTVRIPTPAGAASPAWSPRDDVIAYVEPRGGATGAYAKFIRSTGEPVHDRGEHSELQVNNGILSWSPDGLRLAAASLPGGYGGSLWIVDPGAASPYRKLLDLATGDLIRGITWSRDGSSLVVGRVQRAGDIFFAERSVRQ